LIEEHDATCPVVDCDCDDDDEESTEDEELFEDYI